MHQLKPKGRNDGHIFDFSMITDRIILGSDLCKAGVCLIHGEEFKKLGVSVELNLSQEENELPPKDIETYIWLPVVDGYAPSKAQLDLGTSAIEKALENGKIIFVHCKNGHSRSPTLVIAYLMKYEGYALEDAIKFVSEKRPEVHIEKAQMEVLKTY